MSELTRVPTQAEVRIALHEFMRLVELAGMRASVKLVWPRGRKGKV